MKTLFSILLCLMAFAVFAGTYETVGENGSVTYSDEPIDQHTQKVVLPELNTVKALPSSNPVVQNNPIPQLAPVKSNKSPYTLFTIKAPFNGESIQNQPVILIEIGIDPHLQEGDLIQLYLDGSSWGAPQTKNKIEMQTIDRGTHEIYAALVDKSGAILKKSEAITVYVHQAHLGGAS